MTCHVLKNSSELQDARPRGQLRLIFEHVLARGVGQELLAADAITQSDLSASLGSRETTKGPAWVAGRDPLGEEGVMDLT